MLQLLGDHFDKLIHGVKALAHIAKHPVGIAQNEGNIVKRPREKNGQPQNAKSQNDVKEIFAGVQHNQALNPKH